jgi:hypothetical protein
MSPGRRDRRLTPEQSQRRAEVLRRVRADEAIMRQMRESAEYFEQGGAPIPWNEVAPESGAQRGE